MKWIVLCILILYSCEKEMIIAPINLTAVAITGGVRLTWEDQSTNDSGFQIWRSLNGGAYSLLATVNAGVVTYDDTTANLGTYDYKVRALGRESSSNFASVSAPAPLEFVFTSTGDGSGVGRFTIRVSETTSMTFTGTARFYDDINGNSGETNTKQVTAGALRSFFIKAPSGVSTLRIKNVITQWGEPIPNADATLDGWSTPNIPDADPDLQGINYPSVAIDVGTMTHNTSINVFGLNTIYGDFSAQTGMVYVEIGTGQNNHTQATHGATVTADITGFTSLICLDVWDKTHITGDVATCTALEKIWVGGFTYIYGSITGLPLNLLIVYPTCTTNLSGTLPSTVTYLSLYNVNTITGSVAGNTDMYGLLLPESTNITVPNITNLTRLSQIYLRGIVLTTANINQILADLWTNKDQVKGTTVRSVDLFGAAGSGAPSGQGLTDKAALQAYSSPTPPGTAPLWTITTR